MVIVFYIIILAHIVTIEIHVLAVNDEVKPFGVGILQHLLSVCFCGTCKRIYIIHPVSCVDIMRLNLAVGPILRFGQSV